MRLEFETSVTAPLPATAADNDVTALHGSSFDFQQLLNSGIAAAQSGDRITARRLLFQASGVDPRCEDIWMWLASISEYPEELLIFLNNALDINPNNRRATEWRQATRSLLAKTFVQRAIAAHHDGSPTQADQWLAQAFTYDAECEMAWFWKASFEPTDERKLECLEKVLEINPENEEARSALTGIAAARSNAAFLEVKSAAVAGRRKKAFELVDEFLRSEPNNAEAWILRSHLSLSMEQKLESLQRALEIDPDNGAARSGYDFLTATIDSTQEPDHQEPAESPAIDVSFEKQEFKEEITEATEEPALSEMAATPDVEPFVLEDIFISELPASPKVEGERELDELLLIEITEDPASEQPAFAAARDRQHEAEIETAYTEPTDTYEETVYEAVVTHNCPYCHTPNDAQDFSCGSCRATLTLSDMESLLHSSSVDRETVQSAVTQMEAEWNLRDFSVAELVALGVGHFNLGNHANGFKYVQEASRLDANNVILASQLNTLAIRLDEIRRQSEVHDAMPKGKNILVVDDSATVRKLISGKLEKCGHNVICAEDGIEAIEKLEAGLPDLVLLDITMPRMDGYEVCKQIRANPAAKDLPVVMISGKDGFFDKVRGRMAGTTGYVTKPFGPETLMKALETYLLPDGEAEA